MTEIKTAEQLYDFLVGFIGTTCYYKMHNLIFTEGIYHMAGKVGAFWLLTDISIALKTTPELTKGFYLVRITVNEDCTGKVVIAEDVNEQNVPERIKLKSKLDYTDFPKGCFEMFLQDGILLLKSEY